MKFRDLLAAAVLAAVVLAALVLAYRELDARADAADRQLEVQGCSSEYAATYDAHFAKFLNTAVALGEDPTADQIDEVAFEAAAVAEMAGRRIGLSTYVAEIGDGEFVCPPIPARLVVPGIDPTDADPP